MAEGRPHLIAVSEPAERPLPSEGRRGRRLPWLLAALALLCAVGWGLARRDAAALAGELSAARGALAAATASLEAIEAQRAEVRLQLQTLAADANTLSQRLGEVEALLAADPPPAADAQPTGSEAQAQD